MLRQTFNSYSGCGPKRVAFAACVCVAMSCCLLCAHPHDVFGGMAKHCRERHMCFIFPRHISLAEQTLLHVHV